MADEPPDPPPILSYIGAPLGRPRPLVGNQMAAGFGCIASLLAVVCGGACGGLGGRPTDVVVWIGCGLVAAGGLLGYQTGRWGFLVTVVASLGSLAAGVAIFARFR